jgi:hypothetical protein
VLLVVSPNVPLYPKDGIRLEFRFQLVVPVDWTTDTVDWDEKAVRADRPPVDNIGTAAVPALLIAAPEADAECHDPAPVPAFKRNDIVELAVADTDKPLLVLVAIPPIVEPTFRNELTEGATVKAVTAARAEEDKTFIAVGAAVNTVAAVLVDPVWADIPVMYVDAPLPYRATDTATGGWEKPVRFVTVLDGAPHTEIVHEVDAAAQERRCATAYSPADRLEAAKVNGWTLLLAHPCCRVLAVPEVVVPVAHDTAREADKTDANDVLLPKE